MRDTIFAPATAQGRAAVAVIRISGPEAGRALVALAGRLPRPRRATTRRLSDASGAPVDEAIVLWFPGPESYTGEDVAELQVHGGPAVVGAVTRALSALGLRLAEPGEFTRRAFEAGRMGLDQAEGVADLVDAETEAQARQALAQLEGALGRRYETWRSSLAEALAYVEAAVDFPDEEVPVDVAARALPVVSGLVADLEAALADAARGERVRDGYRIALIGAPNAGKSALFNALLRRDAAIVTPTPGTTRDVLETAIVVEGYKVILADMAGLRAAGDAIEAEGVRRARAWAEAADLRLWVVDGSATDGAWREAADLVQPDDLTVLSKADLPTGADRRAIGEGRCALSVSTLTGEGVEALALALGARVVAALGGADFPAVTRERHAGLLSEALANLARVDAAALETPELAAEDLRLAARALERVTGRIGAEDVLDVVFGSFCIGK
ncbi:MAG TPA: tRNA uridine-5-carboxymethylaminomethyl(34) synthesis GTPase MnmE [Caulobacteraceae bacterium]|nr:tRNA uridine-5-carboxymethylaminomethyl(34) synthesis GTPase MnmE [Caulobacteraceae bacterium]